MLGGWACIGTDLLPFAGHEAPVYGESRVAVATRQAAELRSAWTGEGARPHTSWNPAAVNLLWLTTGSKSS